MGFSERSFLNRWNAAASRESLKNLATFNSMDPQSSVLLAPPLVSGRCLCFQALDMHNTIIPKSKWGVRRSKKGPTK